MKKILVLLTLLLLGIPTFGQSETAESLYEAGQEAYAVFDNDAALEYFNRAIELDPEFAEAYAHRGEIYRLEYEYELAQADFDMAESLEPDNPTVLGHLARWFSHNADDETAFEYINRAIEIASDDGTLYYRRARIYWNRYDYPNALADFAIALESPQVTAGIRLNYAAILNEVGQYDEAEAILLDLMDEYPDFSQPYVTLGYTYLYQGMFEEALDTFAQVEAVDPTRATGAAVRGEIYWTYLGDRETATAEYEHAIEINPDDGYIYVNWGTQYDYSGNRSRATELYKKAIEVDPTRADGFYDLGTIYAGIDAEQAEQYYLRAIELDPRYHQAYLNLGNLYRDQMKYLEAFEQYNLAINVYPDFWVAYWNRGNIQMLVGGFELAIEDYQRATAINPYYGPVYHTIGVAYTNLQEYDLAIDAFETAVSLDPSLGASFYGLGYVYDLIGESEKAQENYQKAEDLGYRQ